MKKSNYYFLFLIFASVNQIFGLGLIKETKNYSLYRLTEEIYTTQKPKLNDDILISDAKQFIQIRVSIRLMNFLVLDFQKNDDQGEVKHREHGFAAIWNHKKQEMRASKPIVGNSETSWLSVEDATKAVSLDEGDVIVGFFHSHNSHRDNQVNQFSWKSNFSGDYSALVDIVLIPEIHKNGSDLNAVFLGVVTLKEIQVIQVKNLDNFLKVWNSANYFNYDEKCSVFKHNPNKFFLDNNFYKKRKK